MTLSSLDDRLLAQSGHLLLSHGLTGFEVTTTGLGVLGVVVVSLVVVGGHVPQSSGHCSQDSPASQTPSPHTPRLKSCVSAGAAEVGLTTNLTAPSELAVNRQSAVPQP